MKIRTYCCCMATLLILVIGSPCYPQQRSLLDEQRALLDGYGPVPVVGQLISAAQDAAEELIAEALDRFDATLLRAAMEARATINQVALRFDDVMDRTIEELDGQQRRVISDLTLLATRITQASDDITDDIDSIITPIRNDIRLLLSRNPGYVHLIPGYAVMGDDYIEFTMQGTALFRARISDFRIGTTLIEPPPITRMDDSRITIRVPLNAEPVLGFLDRADDDDSPQLEVPISFALTECRWWGWVCSDSRKFGLVGYVLPENVGTVKAVFVGDVDTRSSVEVSRGPFVSDRVKSNWLGKSGRRRDVWMAQPDDGWRIDVESATYNFRLLFSRCSSGRSSASWIQQDEQMLRVRVRTETERAPLVTCKTSTTINFTQWRPSTERHTYETGVMDMTVGSTVALPLPSESGLVNARLAHLVVESSLVRNETKILRVGTAVGGLRVAYDPATQTAYLDVQYRN